MITYELAKKLREAGIGDGRVKSDYACEDDTNSLSELIEACGGGFRMLEKVRDKWECAGNVGFYDTPEEAVANLYIELNKK